MRIAARLAAVLAAAGLFLVPGLAVPGTAAAAGGPTSVLLVSPTTGSTAALYHSDIEYEQLQRALGMQPVADPAAPDLHGGPGTAAINVTWLIHDVSVWRVDRVFVDLDGGPWVSTSQSYDGIDLGAEGTVHRAGEPALLLALIEKLGLLDAPAAAAAEAAAVRAPVVAVQQPAAAPAPTDPGSRLTVLAGIAAGALLGAGARPAIGALRRFRRPAMPLADPR